MNTPLDQQPFASIEDLFDKVDVHDIIQLRDGELFMAFSPPSSAQAVEIREITVYGAYSGDGGATWGEPFLVTDEQGNAVSIPFGSLLELKSGALGLYYQFGDGPWVRPPNDVYQSTGLGFWFRRSEDRGKTWTMPILILSEDKRAFQSCIYTRAADQAVVTRTGRIVLPACMRMLGPRTSYPRMPLGASSETSLAYSFALYSDDEGRTWQRSMNLIFIALEGKYPGEDDAPALGKGGFYDFWEPSAVVELSNGSLMMFGRSVIGRTFKSISVPEPMPWPAHHVWESFDTSGLGAGAIWRHPVPTPLACARAPSSLKYIPALEAILCIWNQVSANEIIEGLSRHRLSTALSFDDGETWQHFKNICSLDDVTYVEPPPVPLLHGIYGHHYNQPTDLTRYHHAPGSARNCYPSCRVLDDAVIIQYFTGGAGGDPPDPDPLTTPRRVFPIGWFTE